MRSIPLAMIGDMLRQGRWTLPSLALLVNFFPLVLFTALRAAGAVNPSDPSQITIHIVLIQVNMWMFGVIAMSTQGPLERMYTLPVTAATLVVWRLLLLMVLAAAQCLLGTVLMNALFAVDWPLWGPALLLAVTLAMAQAIAWYGQKSAWSIPMLVLLALGYGAWLKSRYGSLTSPPDHYWREVTVADVAVMLVLAASAFALAIVGVARNRRGEPPLSLGILAWLERLITADFGAPDVLRSPLHAQSWYDWRTKGWVMPGGTAFGLLLGFIFWLIFNRQADDLWFGMFALGAMLTVLAGVGGLIAGHSGPRDTVYDMGSFLATRPLTTTTMANMILKVCALSVLLAWLIWAVAFVGLYGILLAAGVAPLPLLPEKLNWWYYPATLLGPWVAITLATSAGLSARIPAFVKLSGGLLAAWIATHLLAKTMLSTETVALLEQGLVFAVGCLMLIGTLAAFIVAWRRSLIGWPVLYVAATVWTALGALTLLNEQLSPLQSLVTGALTLGVIALAVAPLATAPLALAWNRTR